MPPNMPYLGHPNFVVNPAYQYDFSESINPDVQVNQFQSGVSVRNTISSRKRRTFKLVFKQVTTALMNDLQRFYNDAGGTLSPFWFKPPIERFPTRYTKLVLDGSQKLEDFTSTPLRVGDQSVLVRFTQPFSRTLFKPLLENTGLILEEVFGEEFPMKYMHLDGLRLTQSASIADYAQDFLDMGTKDFMIGFLIRGEEFFTSAAANYAALTGLTLIFTISGTPYTVTFTAAAIDAASVALEINDQQGDKVECLVHDTTELLIRTVAIDGYFTMSGTAFAQLDLTAPVVFPLFKDDTISGYFFVRNVVSGNPVPFDFRINPSVGATVIIESDSSFHLFDGSWHYIVVVVDNNGDGQLYVDGVASGASVDVSSIGDIDNDADFVINRPSLGQPLRSIFDIARIEVRSWTSGSLPSDIVTTIESLNSDWRRIEVDDEDGLQVLYLFQEETGKDSVQQEDLTLNNSPAFFDFDS